MAILKRLLWLGGTPAPYTRRLHSLLDGDDKITIRYVFFRLGSSIESERSYERGELSPKAVVYGKETKKECDALIRDYSRDPQAGILFWGFHPRRLLAIGLKILYSPCKKLFWCDNNLCDSAKGGWLRNALYSFMLGKFDYYLALGSYSVAYYRFLLPRKVFESKTLLHFPVPHMPEEYTVPDRNELEKGDIVRFLCLGRIDRKKNAGAVVLAAKELLSIGEKRFAVIIAGDGNDRQILQSMVERENLGAHVTFPGAVESDRVRDCYAKNHVFIITSRAEPWGVVVNEAMAAGLPVIAPAWIGAAADLILDGYNGAKLLDTKPETIANAMKLYIDNPDLVNIQSRNAAQTVPHARMTSREGHESLRMLFG
jgi:glycosyltransferase involved in cell wall biosynthesis